MKQEIITLITGILAVIIGTAMVVYGSEYLWANVYGGLSIFVGVYAIWIWQDSLNTNKTHLKENKNG